MLQYTLLLVTLFCTLSVSGQNIEELERRNGFKDIRLGMPIDSVKGEKKLRQEFLEQGEFAASLYTVSAPDFEQIGEISVRKVEVRTYKGLIYQINVITEKDPRLMKALESVYGRAVYDLKGDTYFWKGNTLTLKFRSYSRNQLEMIYTSFVVFQMMRDDKEKKVEEIADDF